MGEKDSKKQQLVELREEHRRLDTAIEELIATRAFDQIELQRLKKRKLQLKDEITRLESSILPDIIA